MRVAHEAPISMFDEVQKVTDYDYCLVHLLDESKTYEECFYRAKAMKREIILDNSIFELGHAYDKDLFKKQIVQLEPTWYIIPDVLENAEMTVQNIKQWKSDVPGKKIGVVQGKSVADIIECYREIVDHVDKVAISFDYGCFVDYEWFGNLPTKFHYYMYGRDALIHTMLRMNVIRKDKKHHLLGVGLPQEIASYQDYHWIDSIDTSNPVVAGIKGITYNKINGLEDKPSQKLFTLINHEVTEEQREDILFNIRWFRNMARKTIYQGGQL